MSDDKVFNLGSMRSFWRDFVEKKRQKKEIAAWITEAGEALKTLAGDAPELRLDGTKVAMVVPGQLNKSLLAKEQPEIVKEYTRLVTKEVFDEEAFRTELPHLHEQYRVKRLVLSGETE